ncbi:MAG TPA: hypothetical protein VF411_03005 [Bacteroidia bacterium]
MLKQCTILLSLFMLSAVASAHISSAHKRKKPTTSHNFSGTGIATLVGGTEGKYFKTAHFASSHTKAQVYKPKPTPKIVTKELPLPMPSLHIDFIGGTDRYRDSLAVDSIIKPLATYLTENPKAAINLIGNTGGDVGSPVGSSTAVYNAMTVFNGKPAKIITLMIARAEVVKNYLAIHYNINPNRISTLPGVHLCSEQNRTVGVELRKNLFKRFFDNLFGKS